MSGAVLLLFLIGFAINCKADPNYLYHVCPNTTTFTPNSTYQSNLNLLLSSLASNSTSNTRFHNSTTGQTPNTVYGLFLCRGDVSTDVCQDCVTFATREVVQRCPAEKVAVIWYDECLLRYSNRSFFDSLSDSSMIRLYNTQNATNQTSFNEQVRATTNDVATQALNRSEKFATGARNLSAFNVLYTLAQCTQDLSSSNCQRCLLEAIGNLIPGAVGGRTLTSSCSVRYETYLFYNQSFIPAPPPSPLPPPPPPPPASRGGKC